MSKSKDDLFDVKMPSVKEMKIKEMDRQIREKIRKKVRAKKKEDYYSISLETRRAFIRLCHERKGVSFGDIAREAGIEDIAVALTIYCKNIKTIKYEVLKQPEEVK